MPRQIIDTQSSRPRYVRRLLLIWVVIVLILAALILFALHAGGRLPRGAGSGAAPTAAPAPVLSSPKPPGK